MCNNYITYIYIYTHDCTLIFIFLCRRQKLKIQALQNDNVNNTELIYPQKLMVLSPNMINSLANTEVTKDDLSQSSCANYTYSTHNVSTTHSQDNKMPSKPKFFKHICKHYLKQYI